jgi:arabinofuranan 3-O-arabinosyltransferase
LGAGVSEVRLEGLDLLPTELSTVPREIGCGFGPTLRLGDEVYAMAVTASARQLFDRASVPARVCAPALVEVPAGDTRVVLAPAPAFRPERVVLESPTWAGGGTATAVDVQDRTPVEREVDLGAPHAGGVLAVAANQNRGWVAEAEQGPPLTGLTVDGWQQGWQVPADAQRVTLRFAPDGLYRSALLGGGVLLLLLVVAAATLRGGATQPPVAARGIPTVALLVGALLALGAAAGWWALLCGAAGAGFALAARRFAAPVTVAWASGIPLAAAAAVYWLRPLGSEDGWAGALVAPQLLVAFTVGALVAVDVGALPRPRFFHRIKGLSIRR